MKVLFYHGFGTKGKSGIFFNLRNYYPDYEWQFIKLSYYPEINRRRIKLSISRYQPAFVVGHSLGTLYARYTAYEYGIKALLINPVYSTILTLANKLNLPYYDNHRDKTVIYTQEMHAKIHAFNLQMDEVLTQTAPLLYAIVSGQDERIDPQITRQFMQEHGVKVEMFPAGNHLVSNFPEFFPHVQKALRELQL